MGIIERMLKQAVLDSVVECPYCEHTPLEADYSNCPTCHKANPLKKAGLI